MLKSFFKPGSLALIGASSRKEKLGFKILQNVIDSGFPGSIYPVNPSSDSILDLKSYKNIQDLPETPELAVIVIPAPRVAEALEECGKKGTRAAIIISAGFKEIGEKGLKREDELKTIAKTYGMRVVGPNCLGIIDSLNLLNASFAFDMPPAGNISFITQSGALGTAVLDWAAKEGVGLSKFVSFGNMADVSETDLLEYFGEDPDTSVILLYLEGLKNGQKFIETARRVSMKKPVIMLKSGRSSAGGRAVSSHTGSIAGSDSAYNAAFTQSGVIRAASMQELFDNALLFSYQPMIKGRRVSILTNAGGPGVMAVDQIEEEKLELAALSENTKRLLMGILSSAASVNNPVDVLGDALADTYGKALELVLADQNTDAVVAILSPQVVTQIPETAEMVAKISKKYGKPLVTSFMGGKRMEAGAAVLAQRKIPNYNFPERTVSSLKVMLGYKDWLEKNKGEVLAHNDADRQGVAELLGKIKESGQNEIGDIEGRKILSLYGINTIESHTAANSEEAVAFYRRIGRPVAMKLVSSQILHKTEAGGVIIGVNSEDEVEEAFSRIISSAKNYNKNATIEGIQLQPMVQDGTEVIVGVKKDPQFGHLIMFGLGGIYVELLKDVSFRIAPVTDVDAEEMIDEIKTSLLLKGFRNTPARDIGAIKEVITRISSLCMDFPEIEEMDINPLMVLEKGEGAVAVDARFAIG